MSQNILDKHRDLRAALDPVKTLSDGARVWNEAFCEVYDELEYWVGVVDQDHGVKKEWDEFCVVDFDFTVNPERMAHFLAWLVRRVNAL